MSAVKRSFIFISHIVLLQMIVCIEFTKWIRWNETDVTFGTPMASESGSLKACLLRCQETLGCVAAHVNEENTLCEFSTYNPLEGSLMATPRVGWTVFYKGIKGVQLANVWQSSTFSDCVASNAVDGKFDEYFCGSATFCGCSCAHTKGDFSLWVVELKSPENVQAVLPYFRVDVNQVFRNTNFSIFVHNSFEDGKNGVNGTLCITYTGAPIKSPIKFNCPNPIYGKAVRIQDFKTPGGHNALQFCEVELFVL